MLEKVTATNGVASRRAIAIHRQLILPVAMLLVIAAGVLAALMHFNAGVLDSRAQKASIDAMREGLDERARQLDRVVKDYAWWNEAVDAIQLRQDRAWAEARLGSYLYGTHEYDWAFVIAPDGSTFHAALEGEAVSDDVTTALGNEGWRPLVEQGRAAVAGNEPQAVHAYRADARRPARHRLGDGDHGRGQLAGRAPVGPPYVLVVVRSLTLDWLSELAGALNLGDLTFSLATTSRRPGCSWQAPTGCPWQRFLAATPAGHRVSGGPGAFAGRGAAAAGGLRLVGVSAEPLLDAGHRRERGSLSRRGGCELGLDLRDRCRRAPDLDL